MNPVQINTTNGYPYISIHDKNQTFNIQLHRYNDVYLNLDKKVLPELIEALIRLRDNSNHGDPDTGE